MKATKVVPRDRSSAPKIGANKPKQGERKAKANFQYDPEEDNELGFSEGDIIVVTKIDDSGWWEGECKGKTGMFPGNYVELIPDGSVTSKDRKCVAIFDFTAGTEDELTIVEGDLIKIDSEAEGWMLGTNERGQQGLFPANYVEEV